MVAINLVLMYKCDQGQSNFIEIFLIEKSLDRDPISDFSI